MGAVAHFASSLLGNFKPLNYKHCAPDGAHLSHKTSLLIPELIELERNNHGNTKENYSSGRR